VRVFLIVLDGVGIGALPDAADYGDQGSNTLRHVAEHVGGLRVPTLERLGLGCLESLPGVSPRVVGEGARGRLAERSPGKDSTT
jgi:phosphopentomutase